MSETMISHLAIFDMASGTSETLLQLDQHIEAPNWTRDGNSLVVNGGGRLYKVPLAAPQLQVIDTGFANKLNNDHGISPDGKMLAISDATETGQSCIYTLPFDGTGLARPQRITQRVPSYWHGWSPDGITLTYTAKRGIRFRSIPAPQAVAPKSRSQGVLIIATGPTTHPTASGSGSMVNVTARWSSTKSVLMAATFSA